MDVHRKIKWRKVGSQDLGEGLELGPVGIMMCQQNREHEMAKNMGFDQKEENSF